MWFCFCFVLLCFLKQQQQPGAGNPWGNPGAGNPFAAMMNAPAAPAGLQPEILYRDQIRQLQDMGFVDAAANIRALVATGGV